MTKTLLTLLAATTLAGAIERPKAPVAEKGLGWSAKRVVEHFGQDNLKQAKPTENALDLVFMNEFLGRPVQIEVSFVKVNNMPQAESFFYVFLDGGPPSDEFLQSAFEFFGAGKGWVGADGLRLIRQDSKVGVELMHLDAGNGKKLWAVGAVQLRPQRDNNGIG
ncbi:MAG: hypothetical protein CMA70_04310 [Euryarchaeota archaeon]|nr:hypothetical protein [Euryarchaeota archaeon]